MNRRRLVVLYLGSPELPEWVPFGEDIVSIVGEAHDVRVLDVGRPVVEQVADPNVEMVIDHGLVETADLPHASAGHVRLWQLGSVGYDGLDVDAFVRHGIPVAHCPGSGSATSLAEHALMLMMLVQRNWSQLSANVEAGELRGPTGSDLAGRRLLIVGLGASGRALAKRANALAMRVRAIHGAGANERLQRRFGLVGIASRERLDDELAMADVVSLHVPLNAETRRVLSRDRLARLPAGAVVVNVSRGGLIDEHALAEEIRSGRLGGAGLDVVNGEPADENHPLRGIPNVIITPHVAGNTFQTSVARARFARHNANRVARGDGLRCLVRGPASAMTSHRA